MILFVLAAGIAQAQAPAPEVAPRFAVAFATTEFRKGQKIGSKKAGLLCLPNGAVRWGRDDFYLDGDELGAAVRSSLGARGLALPSTRFTTFATAGEGATHLVGVTVTGGRFDLCVPKWGLGNRRALRGGASLEAKWEIFSNAEKKVVATVATRQTFNGEAPDFAALLGKLIDRSIDQVVASARVEPPDRAGSPTPEPE